MSEDTRRQTAPRETAAHQTTDLICVTCPMGCALKVSHEGTTVLEISGNDCRRGEAYAAAELADPRRMVASTVQVQGGVHPLVPVYTTAALPKPLIFDLLAELRQVVLQAPIEADQLVLNDVLGTGVVVRTSRALPAEVEGAEVARPKTRT